MSGAVRSWRVAAMLLRRTPNAHVCVRYCVMCNSRAAPRLGHARRRSLNWSGGVCCHHCRGGASDEPPSSPLQSPPPLKPPHQRRRACPGIEPGLHACVRRRRCLRWRRRSRRRRQQQQRRRGVYVSGGSSRGRPRSRPRSRHGDIVRDRAGARPSAARARRAAAVPLVVMK